MTSINRIGELPFQITLAFLAALGSLILYYCLERWGIGIHIDSISYLSASEEFLKGNGFSTNFGDIVPMTKWPPLYPLILSFLSFFHLKPLESARVLNCFLYGANAIVVGNVIAAYTEIRMVGIAGAGILLLSPVYIEIHSQALSEPLFIFFAIPGYFALCKYLAGSNRVNLILSASCLALAVVTRYAGLAFILAGLLSILFYQESSVLRRAKNAAAFLLLSLLLLFCWFLRNIPLRDYFFGKKNHVIQLPGLEKAFEASRTMAGWLEPLPSAEGKVSFISFLLLLIAVVTMAVLYIKIRKKRTMLPINMLLILIGTNALLIVAALSFRNSNLFLKSRLLFPIFLSGYITFFLLIGMAFKTVQLRWRAKELIIGTLSAYFVLNLIAAKLYFSRLYQEGSGYTGALWQNSKLIAQIRNLPAGSELFTNKSPDVVHFLAKRAAKLIPRERMQRYFSKKKDAPDKLARFQKKFGGEKIYFAVFKKSKKEKYEIFERELRENMQLKTVGAFEDGNLYVSSQMPVAQLLRESP